MIVISYDSGLDWGVTSEWVGDKLREFMARGEFVTLLTGPRSKLENSEHLRVLKPYSLSWTDFGDEIRLSGMKASLSLNYAFAFTIGRLFDFLFKSLAGSRSLGKWSWVFCAFFVGYGQAVKEKSPTIFTTGGPSGAHLVGLLLKLVLPKTRLFIELQDPFVGSEMVLSPSARKALIWLEAKLIQHATKLVFVTKTAASRAIERHKDRLDCENVVGVYPGAWDFLIKRRKRLPGEGSPVRFLHLGTLYSNRNLDLFFDALDSLRDRVKVPQVEICNLGQLAVQNASSYVCRSDFRDLGMLDRVQALEVAADADFLLLVQHIDSRSEETIPYKTYDYLNLGVPILALTNNDELNNLILDSGGYIANSGIKSEIENAILAALKHRAGPHNFDEGPKRFSFSKQVDLIFET